MSTSVAVMTRPPLTVDRIVGVARGLLSQGGVEAVTIREVARGLSVTAPALYKHVQGRGELVDQLTIACLDELTCRLTTARDAHPPAAYRARLGAAGRAMHAWALENRAEFALLFATPVTPFERSTTPQVQEAGQRMGGAFLEILVPAALEGRLRATPDAAVPEQAAVQLMTYDEACSFGLSASQLWTIVAGFQDLLGMVAVEAFGQLGFALTDTEAFMAARLDQLASELLPDDPAEAGA